MNPRAETVEELKSRRKRLHMGMVKLAREDLERQTQQAEAAFQARPRSLPRACTACEAVRAAVSRPDGRGVGAGVGRVEQQGPDRGAARR